MKALMIEPHSPATYPFIIGLHETTHCQVRHERTLDAGLKTMAQAFCGLVLVAMNEQLPSASEIVGRIASRATELLVRRPYVILLFENSIPIPDALKCREMGAMCMRREFPQVIYDEARLACWMNATRKHDTTIRIAFRAGRHALYFGSSPVETSLGAQLTKLVVILLGGKESYSLEYLADELGICRQSVKKYVFEIRRIFGNIFWIERRSGGSVCGVTANGVWI